MVKNVRDEREAIGRIIDPGTWCDRDAYVRLMTMNGGCPLETVNAIADRRVRDSLALADAILARLSPDRGQAEALEQYERGIHDASIWLRDQQHQNPPDSLWHAAAILADRMNAALLPATPSDRGQAMSTPGDGGRVEARCPRCANRREVPDQIGIRSYPEQRPCPDCTDGTWADADRLKALATPSTPGVREALEKCRDQFRFYETSHMAKGSIDGDAKARTNCEFAEMCEAALSALSKEQGR